MARVRLEPDLGRAVEKADFVCESISENLEAKQDLFARLDAACPPRTILTTNSSSLSLSQVGARIARRDKLITNFGILMDPLAEKIMVCSAFIAFVGAPNIRVPAWMAVVIVARELAITGLRLVAAAKNVVLAAERYGKHKTAWQIIAIIALLVDAGYDQWGPVGRMIFGFQGHRHGER